MTPMQQMLLGVGGAKKTYIDDVFSTYVYQGTQASRSFNNGINLSGEGGLVWIKHRDGTYDHNFYDTERGVGKYLESNSTNAEQTSSPRLNAFNNNGFSIGANAAVNANGNHFTSFSFRKTPGFCDVITYTGTGTSTNADGHLDINHSLGSIPGMVVVKRTSGSSNWWVFHRGMDNNSKSLFLQSPTGNSGSTNYWNNTSPTATQFTVGEWLNGSGSTYVAYVFAGGKSTAATARSVDFDGTGDWLSIASTSDFDFGTGDFTIEFWQLTNDYSGSPYVCDFRTSGNDAQGSNRIVIYTPGSGSSLEGKLGFWLNGGTRISTKEKITKGTWSHYALVRNSGTTTLYQNGTAQGTYSDSTDYEAAPLEIGHRQGQNQEFNGKISNFRVVKGTAVYTSSFRPPTEPLTNITNTKLLCCNNSSTTGSTVTPGTITASGNPTASTDSPFDDPAGFVFGDAGDQNVIKCGNYKGESSHSSRLEVNLGFEPQWVLIKNADSSKDWVILDSMRRWEGDADNVSVSYLVANSNSAESDGQMSGITPTGFVCQSSSLVNGGSDNFVYVAIRRPDPLVQKPAKLGTDVFAMDTGDGNPSALPSMDSNFPVDFGTIKLFDSNQGWYTGSRLTGSSVVFTNTTDAASNNSILKWDSNEGFWKNLQSTYQGWMWKRHAGFDCIFYKGDAVTGRVIRHNLSKPPEMIWIKKLDQAEAWAVGHKDLDGGNEPWTHHLQLESTGSEQDYPLFNDQAPSSHQFAIHQNDMVNGNSHKYVAMLFASTAVSKVGSYTGSSSEKTITTGFTPRLIIIKKTNGTGSWWVFDTLRNLGSSGNDKALFLDSSVAQSDLAANYINTTATGFVMPGNIENDINYASGTYIYYAHA